MKTSNPFKNSLNRLAATAIVFGALGTAAPAFANTASKADTKAKPVVVKTSAKSVTKTKRARPKLPREWVWKKYAKNFDSMFRR